MEIKALVKDLKNIYFHILDFIDAIEGTDAEFETFIVFLYEQNILQNQGEVSILFQLISRIADNHHRTSDFFDKLEKIFQYLIKDFPSPISYFIPDCTKYNKRILFLLLEKNYVKPDELFLNKYLQSKNTNNFSINKYLCYRKGNDDKIQLYYYLYPKMKKYLKIELQKQIEEEIVNKFDVDLSTFEKKCQIGENDSYVCSLIRSDSIEEFISYVNRTNLSLSTKIKPSIYETNSFLIDKEPTLIEYAAFFGSIQIIHFLKGNKVPLTSSLWLYAIHSNNIQLIHFLEENEVKPENNNFDNVLIESIKCHHNIISNYILYEEMQSDDENQFYKNFIIASSLNFLFYPNDIFSMISKSNIKTGFNLSQLCFSLKIITIPSSVTSIGDYAFSGCTSLIQISIPSSVTEIGKYAFYECLSLKQILIPSSITSIGNNAFNGCSSLTQISIPSSVTSIGSYAFYGCSSLKQISIPSSLTSIENDIFNRCTSLTIISIPFSVTSIGNFAFRICPSLTQISIPSSVTSIGYGAFYKCSSLAQISIPSSVTSIRSCAFYGCSSLTQISIPSSVTKIGNFAFKKCSSLTQISIPSSVISIGEGAFKGCSSLTHISISSSVIEIGYFVFKGCSSLTQISIPSSVISIEGYAFSYCSSLIQISIPFIKDFGFSKLWRVSISSFVPKIEYYVFYNCCSVTQISIPSFVTKNEYYAFHNCYSLTQISIPSIKIFSEAFQVNVMNSFDSLNSSIFQLGKKKLNVNRPDSLSPELKNLIKKCWKQEPAKMPTFAEILEFLESNTFVYSNNDDYKAIEDFYSINTNMNDLIKIMMIAREDFYEVYEVKNKNTKETFLANVFYILLDYYTTEERVKIFKSINNILQINHLSIIKSYNFNEKGFYQEIRPTLFTEFISKITLNDIITSKNINFDYNKWDDTKKLTNIYGIASGMSYLHSKEILHYDLTPNNIIEDSNLYPKIKNIGFKGVFKDLQSILKRKKQSTYFAPECYTDNKYTKESEVYSFGIIIYQIMTNEIPFKNDNIITHIENIINENYVIDQEKIPEIYKELISKCLSRDPTKRPTFENIVHEFDKNPEFITEEVNEEEFNEYKKNIQINNSNDNGDGNNDDKKDDNCESNNGSNEDNGDDNHNNNNNDNDKNSGDDDGNNNFNDGNSGDGNDGNNNNDGNSNDDFKNNNNNEEEEYNEFADEEKEENSFIIEQKDVEFLEEEQIGNITKYKKGKRIGNGSSCYVYKSILKNNRSQKYAAKMFYLSYNESKIIKDKEECINQYKNRIIFEIKCQSKYLHPLIPKFFVLCPNRTNPVMMLEFVKNGSIEQMIKKVNSTKERIDKWNDTTKMINIYGIASIMKYLSTKKIIHRDLKPANILLDENFQPKLTDFGISIKVTKKLQNKEEEPVGTSPYMAPEIWLNNEYSEASDVYAFGILVYEIITDTLIYRDKLDQTILYLVAYKNQSLPKANIPKFYNDLIKLCVKKDPKKRPTFEEIINIFDKEFLSNSDLNEYKRKLNQ